MSESGLRALLSPTGFQLLESLSGLGSYTPELGTKLRQGLHKRGVEPNLVAAVVSQLELRETARKKFGDFASGMLLTRAGLEQATRLPVAAFHAARFHTAACRRVADLGCGLGAESLALAGIGLQVDAFEQDEATAAFALLNLRAFPEATVTCADYTRLDWQQLREQGVDGAFADPARRDGKGRVRKPAAWSPPLPFILDLVHEIPEKNLGIKVGPGINYSDLPAEAQVEWVSVNGELVEAGIWLGGLRHSPANPTKTNTAPTPGRSALLLDEEGKVKAWLEDPQCRDPRDPAPTAPTLENEDQLGQYLFEPDSAVIRAGLTAQAARLVHGVTVSSRIAYLSADTLPHQDTSGTTLGTWFKVEELLPLHPKALKKTLTARGVRSLEIKKRGADVNPAELRKQILPKPDPAGTDLVLIATRLAGKHRAILARRLP